jgi:SAM-dependent methyltransferase
MGQAGGASRVKGILRRVPGLATTYRHARLLSSVAYERWWLELQQSNDRAILNGEWHFETDAEQQRYHAVLSAIGRLRGPAAWGDVLEIGCAQGLFTRELVERSNSVTACDVSPIACERTAVAVPGARVRRIDISREGGLLIFNELRFHDPRVESSWWPRALVEGGLELVKFLNGRDGLSLLHQEDHRDHVIGLYEKRSPISRQNRIDL